MHKIVNWHQVVDQFVIIFGIYNKLLTLLLYDQDSVLARKVVSSNL